MSEEELDGKWIVGQGFKPAVPDNIGNKPGYAWSTHPDINGLSSFDANDFTPFTFDMSGLVRRTDPRFHAAGFKQGFYDPRIIIPQGIKRSE